VGVEARVVILETGGCRGFKIVLVVLQCANCLMHETVGGALSETVETVSLSTVPRLSPL